MKNIFLSFFILVTITLSAQQTKLLEKSETEPYTTVDQIPSFPGGETAYIHFLQSNLVYPDSAVKKEIEGKVNVKFVVCEDGSICDLKILNSPDSLLSKAAYDIIAKMPNWKPGILKGKIVRVKFVAHINFSLLE
jgi:TonB family protein